MTQLNRWIVISLLTLAAACSEPANPNATPAPTAATPAPATAPDPAASAPLDGHELQRAIHDPLDRAKAVEGDLQKASESLNEAEQEQGG